MKDRLTEYRAQMQREIQTAFERLDLAQVDAVVQKIVDADRVFCDGLGRSGLAMRGFAMRLGQMGKRSTLVGEATAPALKKGDLLLICTASGTSPVLLYHAEKTRKLGGMVLLITGNPQSPLTGLADGWILVQAPDKDQTGSGRESVQPMGSLFEQVSQLLCDLMAVELMERWGLNGEKMRQYHANIE